MSEISLQAVQFTPRLFTMVVLVALTWLVGRFAQYLVLRAMCDRRNEEGVRDKFAKTFARLSSWSVYVVMVPFIFNAAGLDGSWLHTSQQFIAQVFVNWPVWMILSLLVAGIAFVVRGVPRVLVQLKGTLGTSQSEV